MCGTSTRAAAAPVGIIENDDDGKKKLLLRPLRHIMMHKSSIVSLHNELAGGAACKRSEHVRVRVRVCFMGEYQESC